MFFHTILEGKGFPFIAFFTLCKGKRKSILKTMYHSVFLTININTKIDENVKTVLVNCCVVEFCFNFQGIRMIDYFNVQSQI